MYKKPIQIGESDESTWYIRDAQGNILAIYQKDGEGNLALTERPIYGSSRLGVLTSEMESIAAGSLLSHTTGDRHYELTNHLGNVLVTVSDRKIIEQTPYYTYKHKPEVKSVQDYYAFGMLMPGRNSSSGGYRFGFQGQENINEIYGEGNYLDYTHRGFNPRLSRFFAVDPFAAQYPFYSTYQFSGNRVIDMIELEGLEPIESGSYGGQGNIAPQRDESGNVCKGTEDQRWTWNNNIWNSTDVGITKSELTTLFQKGNIGLLKTVETTLNLEGASFGISSQKELNGFIAQTGFETQGFTKLTENLNYSLSGLRSNFSRLDKYSDNYLNSVRGDANKLAVILYGGSGNGIDYRGRGLIHTTWEVNYKKASNQYNSRYGTNYDFTKTPALLATNNQIAVRSALIFFKTNGLFGMQNYDINAVSKKVNFYDMQSFPSRSALYQKVSNIVR